MQVDENTVHWHSGKQALWHAITRRVKAGRSPPPGIAQQFRACLCYNRPRMENEPRPPARRSARNRRRRERNKQSRMRNAIAISLTLALVLIAAVLIVNIGKKRAEQDNAASIATEEDIAFAGTGSTTDPFTTYNVPEIPETERSEPSVTDASTSTASDTSDTDAATDAASEASTEEDDEPRIKENVASIVYMPNGAAGDPIVVECLPNANAVIEDCLFANTGMVFKGWSRDENGYGDLLSPMNMLYIDGDTATRLYAQWTPATDPYLTITNTDVSDSAGRVDFAGSVASDNGRYRLYVVYGDGERLAAEVSASASGTITFAGDNLYAASFVIRALQNGVEVNICDVQPLFRITDSDAGLSDPSRVSIKGILADHRSAENGLLAQLGVHQVIYNLYLPNFLDPKGGATIPFEYNGKTYAFSASAAASYDHLVNSFSSQGLEITMVLINDKSGANPLIHQTAGAGGAGTHMYMLATTPEALELESALGAFLAGRYSAVRNWIIGNEVDAWLLWNYMNAASVEEYVSEYSKGFRAFYNGILSANGNARVYISLTQNWTGSFTGQYKGRDVLDLFAAYNRDINWNLAYHPYPWPMTDVTAWDSPNTSMTFDTKTITLENISVLTEYMGFKRNRNPDGSRKSIILSEFGYTSLGGNEVNQAASIVYAYVQALRNPHIDAFLLAREIDHAAEIAEGLATGIRNADGSAKTAWDWYAAMGTSQQQQIIDQVYSYIGF